MIKMAHVSNNKKEVVKKVVNLSQKYPIIGIVNLANLPAKQLQTMREKLRGKVEIFMTKKRLMSVAFEELKKKNVDYTGLNDYLKGMPAIIFTSENPFKIYKIIKQNKSSAPAKAGQEAPNDIVIPAGKTPFAPGPVIGELGALGVKSQVEDGKVAITSDAVVCKEGGEISRKLAEMLTRLNILPMEVGLELLALIEKGIIYTKSVLDVDETEFENKLINAARWGQNLAVEIAFPTKETIPIMIGKAFNDSKGLALELNILTSETVKDLLGKAEMQMTGLKNTANIEVPDKKVEKKEKPKVEEKKEEQKPEEKKEEPKIEKKEPAPKEEIKESTSQSEEKKIEDIPTKKDQDLTVQQTEKTETQKEESTEDKVEPKPEEVKEEPKVEEKTEDKQPEKQKEDVDDVVKKMVEEQKQFAKGEIPSAADLLNDAKKETPNEEKKEK